MTVSNVIRQQIKEFPWMVVMTDIEVFPLFQAFILLQSSHCDCCQLAQGSYWRRILLHAYHYEYLFERNSYTTERIGMLGSNTLQRNIKGCRKNGSGSIHETSLCCLSIRFFLLWSPL